MTISKFTFQNFPEPKEPPPPFPPQSDVYDLDVVESPANKEPPPLPMRRGGSNVPPVPNRSAAPPPLPARPNSKM